MHGHPNKAGQPWYLLQISTCPHVSSGSYVPLKINQSLIVLARVAFLSFTWPC